MAVLSNVYPNDKNEAVGPLLKRGNAVSVQIAVVSGSGAVGTYQLQVSNDGEVWIDQGSTMTSAGITEFATVIKQSVRVSNTVAPDSGTVVKVSLYADAPME